MEVALSGGADSTGLVLLARAAGLVVSATHVDHGLRPESGADAERVVAMMADLDVAVRVVRVELDDGADLENRARLARRAVLGAEAMTGHTMDDQAETVVLHLLRGSGPTGLSAMRPGHRHPVLGLRRHELAAVCADAGLTPIIDPSNTDPRFRRNRVRAEVLPLLADVSEADVVPVLARVAEHQRGMDDLVVGLAAEVDPTDVWALRDLPRPVAAAALRRWLRDDEGHPPSSAELARVFDVVEHRAAATELRGGRRLARTAGRLRLEPDR